jgi:glycerol-3-phosphate acyltransferase PlsY
MHEYFGTEVGAVSGFLTILGHMFPIWLKFKGGKGVASYMGFMLATSWPLFILLIFNWLVIVKVFKYSAIAAIISILINLIIFKMILFTQFKYNILLWIKGDPIEFQFILFTSIIILIKHYTNVINIFKK